MICHSAGRILQQPKPTSWDAISTSGHGRPGSDAFGRTNILFGSTTLVVFLSKTEELPMLSFNSLAPRIIPHEPGGEHVECWVADPEELVERMPDISEVKEVYDVCKPTSAMGELVSHLRRLSRTSRTPKGGLCFTHACCDISDAWQNIGRGVHVLSGVSAKGGTLVLLFAPADVDSVIIEANCRF
jgi:hypothetical protein